MLIQSRVAISQDQNERESGGDVSGRKRAPENRGGEERYRRADIVLKIPSAQDHMARRKQDEAEEQQEQEHGVLPPFLHSSSAAFPHVRGFTYSVIPRTRET